MRNRLDHFMYAGADLNKLIASFTSLSGLTPDRGGTHPGLGTRNALASLGDDVYLELIAPDPEQARGGPLGDKFRQLTYPRLFAYMVRADDLERIQSVLAGAGIESDLSMASRKTPGGETLKWQLLLPRNNPFGDHIPKFINWMGTRHPAGTSVKGCTFVSFEIGHPEASQLGALLRSLEVDVPLVRADRPYLRTELRTPKGPLVLMGGG